MFRLFLISCMLCYVGYGMVKERMDVVFDNDEMLFLVVWSTSGVHC